MELSAVHSLWHSLLGLDAVVVRIKLGTKAGFYQHWAPGVCLGKVSKHSEICLWLYSSAGLKLHRVGQEGFLRVGQLLPPRLIQRGERSALLDKDGFFSTGNDSAQASTGLTL